MNIHKIKNKKVFLRVDYNVSIKNKKVVDNFRLLQSLDTIKLLLKNNNQIVLGSHLGRPKGQEVKKISLSPVFEELKKLLPKVKIKFLPHFSEIRNQKHQILFLENLRFQAGEQKNSAVLAKKIGKGLDFMVDEAFSLSHRKTASNTAIKKVLPNCLGLNYQKEIEVLSKVLKPKKPATVLLGGIKIKDKLPIIESLIKNYRNVLLSGGVANTFFKVQGYQIGKSNCGENDLSKKAKKILKLKQVKRLILPVDLVVADENYENVRLVDVKKNKDKVLCQENELIYDIGPKTIKLFSDIIKKSQTILWSGPPGFIDVKKFSHGSLILAKVIASRSSGRAFGVAGGGSTIETIKKSKMARYYDFISTGGGAMLDYLSS